MGIVIDVLNLKLPVFPAKLCDGSVLADGKPFRVGQRDPGNAGKNAADGDAVADDGNGFPFIFDGDAPELCQSTLPHLPEGFRTGQLPVFRVVNKTVGQLRLLVTEISEKLPLPWADIQLAKRFPFLHQAPGSAGGGFGSKDSTGEVAGIDGIQREFCKTPAERIGLPQAQGGYFSVPVALHHAVAVPFCLCMPYEVNFCHSEASTA